MSFPDAWPPRPMLLPMLVACLALAASVRPATAQDGIDDIFDDPKPKAEAPLPNPAEGETESKADAEADAPKRAGDSPAAPTLERGTIGFTQENAAAQMSELEERMFRLSEALLRLEPENASRLRLALKFSRDEAILQQMRESTELLEAAQLARAETEVRQLLAKLEHLRSLLLAEDLDFQLKLARLRQMRETLGQLERIIKEEQRELAWSRKASESAEELDRLRSLREDLGAIVREQRSVVETTTRASEDQAGASRDEAIADAIAREAGVRESANALANTPPFNEVEPALLARAIPLVEDTTTFLEADNTGEAIDSGRQALELFEEQLAALDAKLGEAEADIAEDRFRQFERDQARNRESTDTLAQVSSRIGDSGVALQKDLITASGAMKEAEGNLSRTEAEPAADRQDDALKALIKSRQDLAAATEKLLVELRIELQAQIIADLAEMHEMQVSIRESTEAQAPRAAQKSRTALIALANLAKTEAELASRMEQLTDLVEITEFGIALPTSLRVLGREMSVVEALLKAGDATEPTVKLERRIEEDLLGLLQAMRRLPPTTPPPPGTPLPSNLRDRERELNRLVAELKMIRLLQSRLNDDTVIVDESRPEFPDLPSDLRRQIEALRDNQDEIRESLGRIGQQLEPPDLSLPGGGKVDL